ncbi:MAG: ASPIC/UnbV domain-containing protein, partial [Bradymonadia bacterium]
HGESGSQPLSIFRWGKNNNNFLRISPQTRTGGPARGARVILEMNDGRIQQRVIDSGSAYLCQMEPVAHFGLGLADDVRAVTVIWPDGGRTRIESPGINKRLDVSYPASE